MPEFFISCSIFFSERFQYSLDYRADSDDTVVDTKPFLINPGLGMTEQAEINTALTDGGDTLQSNGTVRANGIVAPAKETSKTEKSIGHEKAKTVNMKGELAEHLEDGHVGIARETHNDTCNITVDKCEDLGSENEQLKMVDSATELKCETDDCDVVGSPDDGNSKQNENLFKTVKVEYNDDYDADTDVESYATTLTNVKAKQIKKNSQSSKKSKEAKSEPDASIYCKDCRRTFNSRQKYDLHLQKNNGKCYFECEYCSKVFYFKRSKLDVHVRSAHTKERPYVCDVCGKGYVTSDKLRIHIRVHTGEKPCVCDVCGKAFYSLGQLSIHKNYHHVWKQYPQMFKCDQCGSGFSSKHYLRYHLKVIHCKTKDFHCHKCGKAFKSSDSLRYHLKFTHADGNKYKCDTCEKTFKAPAGLRRHKYKNHTTVEKRFACTICDKAFVEKDKLKMHINVHTGEKPFKCNMCDFRCAFSGNLSKHKKTHSSKVVNLLDLSS